MISIGVIAHVPSIHNAPPSDRQSILDALGAYLDSELIIERTPGFSEAASEGDAPAITLLKFCDDLASGGATVFIRLSRNGKRLTLDPIKLSYERDPLNILFRAVATAAKAAHTGRRDAPAASRADAQELRRDILDRLCPGIALANPLRHTPVPGNWDIDAGNDVSTHDEAEAVSADGGDSAGFREIQAMAARYDRERIERAMRSAAAEERVARSAVRITRRRPHASPPIMSEMEVEPAALRQGGKRRRPSGSTEASPPQKLEEDAYTPDR